MLEITTKSSKYLSISILLRFYLYFSPGDLSQKKGWL